MDKTPDPQNREMLSIKVQNNAIVEENKILRERLRLLKINAGLRAANVTSEIVSWIDALCTKGEYMNEASTTTKTDDLYQSLKKDEGYTPMHNINERNVKSIPNDSVSLNQQNTTVNSTFLTQSLPESGYSNENSPSQYPNTTSEVEESYYQSLNKSNLNSEEKSGWESKVLSESTKSNATGPGKSKIRHFIFPSDLDGKPYSTLQQLNTAYQKTKQEQDIKYDGNNESETKLISNISTENFQIPQSANKPRDAKTSHSATTKRRGSIVYDTADISINFHPSTGFDKHTSNEVPHKSSEVKSNASTTSTLNSVFLSDDTPQRTHGHTWEKKGRNKFAPQLMSTPQITPGVPESVRNKDRDSGISNVDRMDTMINPEMRKSFPLNSSNAAGTIYQAENNSSVPMGKSYESSFESSTHPDFKRLSSSRNYIGSSTSPEYVAPALPDNNYTENPIPQPKFTSPVKPSVNGSISWSIPIPGNSKLGNQHPKLLKSTRRIIGEICFQLDRKILNMVFQNNSHDRKRFYGYIIQNIPQKIDKECQVEQSTGSVDVEKKKTLFMRYQHILNILEPAGYDVSFHPDFCADMVNKYGLLPITSQGKKNTGIYIDQADVILDAIKKMTSQEELKHMLVILDCLSLLCKEDGGPIISF